MKVVEVVVAIEQFGEGQIIPPDRTIVSCGTLPLLYRVRGHSLLRDDRVVIYLNVLFQEEIENLPINLLIPEVPTPLPLVRQHGYKEK
jgi:hypothetical protein